MFIGFSDRNGNEHIVNAQQIVSMSNNTLALTDGFEIKVDDNVYRDIERKIAPLFCGTTLEYTEVDYGKFISTLPVKKRIQLFTGTDVWSGLLRDRIRADVGNDAYEKLVYRFAVR